MNKVYEGIEKSLEEMSNEELKELFSDYEGMQIMIIEELNKRAEKSFIS